MKHLSDKDSTSEHIWECRKTKIELEHEVLLREMDVILVALAGFPITIVTIILQFELWNNSTLMIIAIFSLVLGIIVFDDLRSNKKEKIVAKQKELEACT